jgi:hypothetical protein
MKPKTYTAHQAAGLQGTTYNALQRQLHRDSKKPRSKRKYPNARKMPCCGAWVIPDKDLEAKK